MSKVLTLRRLEPGETPRDGDYYCSTDHPGYDHTWREVNPIPDGYEVCDLADATKVLIGETWCETMDVSNGRAVQIGNSKIVLIEHLEVLGVLAICPIPEPEPMRGEGVVTKGIKCGFILFKDELIGKTIRWEEVKPGGSDV